MKPLAFLRSRRDRRASRAQLAISQPVASATDGGSLTVEEGDLSGAPELIMSFTEYLQSTVQEQRVPRGHTRLIFLRLPLSTKLTLREPALAGLAEYMLKTIELLPTISLLPSSFLHRPLRVTQRLPLFT